MGTGLSRLVGVGCLLGALYCAQRTLEFRRHGEIVPGTVVAIDAQVTHDDDGVDYSERAEIRYTPRSGGKPRILRSNWNNVLFGSHDIGDTVDVRYLPDRPDDARQDSLLLDWLLPGLLLVLGAAGVTGRLQSDHSGPDRTLWRGRRE
jgi:hypothetical protein